MKYELVVKATFKDKYTGEIHNIGETMKVEKARGEELLADSNNVVELKKVISKKPVEDNEDVVEVEAPKKKKSKKEK